MKYFLLCLAQAAAISLAAPASASPFYPTEAAVFFSPNGGAENAIVQSIDSAKVRIRMQAFLFSNKEITQALIRAHQRGVKVDVIIDKKMPKKKPNTTEDLLILKSKPLAEEYVKNWEKHFSHSVLAAPEKEKGTEVPLTKNQN